MKTKYLAIVLLSSVIVGCVDDESIDKIYNNHGNSDAHLDTSETCAKYVENMTLLHGEPDSVKFVHTDTSNTTYYFYNDIDTRFETTYYHGSDRCLILTTDYYI